MTETYLNELANEFYGYCHKGEDCTVKKMNKGAGICPNNCYTTTLDNDDPCNKYLDLNTAIAWECGNKIKYFSYTPSSLLFESRIKYIRAKIGDFLVCKEILSYHDRNKEYEYLLSLINDALDAMYNLLIDIQELEIQYKEGKVSKQDAIEGMNLLR